MSVRWRTVGILLSVVCGMGGFSAGDPLVSQRPTPEPLRTLLGHCDAVRCVAFSPDGKKLASGGLDGTARLWDVSDGKELATFRGHTEVHPSSADRRPGIHGLAFTPDGKTLATGGSDGTIKLWDVASAKELRTLTGHTDRVRCVAVDSRGKRLASASDDRTVRLWEVGTWAKPMELTGHARGVECVAFDPAGRVVSGSGDGSLRLWDADSSKGILTFPMDEGVLSVACAPDGRGLAAGHPSGAMTLWHRGKEMSRQVLAGHRRGVCAVAFAPDGRTLASASPDGRIKLWDVATGREVQAFDAHRSGVWAVAFSPDGRTLASGGQDREVKLWDVSGRTSPATAPPSPQAAAEPPRPALPQPGETEAVAGIKRLGGRFLAKGCKASWSPDGTRIVFGDGSGLKVLDVNTGRIRTLATPGKDPAWSPGDGRSVAYVTGNDTGEEIWLVEAAGGSPRKLTEGGFPGWSADGKTLFVHAPAKAKLQAIPAGAKGAPGTDLLSVSSRYPAMSADGTKVAYRSGNEVLVVDRVTGKTIRTWPMAGGVGCLPGWSPDGKHLGFGGHGIEELTGLWLLDVEKNQAVRVAGGPVTMPAWSPDGAKLAFDLRLRTGSEIWMIETRNLTALQPQAMATDRLTVPEAAAELVGPLHRPQGRLVCLDLKRHANRKLAATTGELAGNDLGELPQGEQTWAGVRLRIADSAIQLGSTRLPEAPARAEGIPVQRRVVMLYILHATQWGDPRFGVSDGTLIGQYRVHYADGSDATIPIVCGEDVRDWWSYDARKPVTRGQVVWAGRNAAARRQNLHLRLFLAAWENPHPEKTVARIDYVSTMTAAAPFCVAMTAEEPGPAD